MQESVNLEISAKKIRKGLLASYPQPPSGLSSVKLWPVQGIRPPDAASLSLIISEFGEFITQVSNEWPQHPEWNGPQRYRCQDLGRWPTLASHFRVAHFNLYVPDPNYILNMDSQDEDIRVTRWIMFDVAPGEGSFNHCWALHALFDAVRKKLSRYGPPGKMPVELVVHYSRAATRNAPFYGAEIQEFEDVAKWLAEEVPGLLRSLGTCPFRTIYLLDEGYPNPVAFAVYPAFNRCV
jgi:hypothetical protein